jgi:hypothetical protein
MPFIARHIVRTTTLARDGKSAVCSTLRRPGRTWPAPGLVLVAITALIAPGCQAARMPLPEGLATAERLPVSGRQGLRPGTRLRFGSFEAHPVTRSWTRGRERGAIPTATERERTQTYRFTLREDGAERWFVACRASLRSVRFDVGPILVNPSDESALYCNLQAAGDERIAWELELEERHGRPLAGTLALAPTRLNIVGTARVESALPMGLTTGYEIRVGDDVLGAVEVINGGAIWLRHDLDPGRRQLLAATAAALLLLEDLYATIRE